MSSARPETPLREGLPPLPRAGATPRAVRDALHPEHREAFDRAFRAALETAERELDLQAIHETVEYWRRRAWITRDPEEHRRVVREAVTALTGEMPPDDEPTDISERRL
ncbi:DUF6247 family protein [Actinomycetospora flava]|uniref:DUF6247 family protein n=1 Tax=Actinomycetospora flava TaxID=3129232 RepID=A0ABU8M716_9PSEU